MRYSEIVSYLYESSDNEYSQIEQELRKYPRIPMGDDYISTQSVGMKPFIGMVRLPPRFNSTWKKTPESVVDISDIQTAQGYLSISKTIQALKYAHTDPITLLRQDGKLIMTDGNHRLAAAILTNKKQISAKILEAGEEKKKRRY